MGQLLCYCKTGAAETRTQIINGTSRAAVAFGEHADHRNNRAVARYRSVDHVLENTRHLVVESKRGRQTFGRKHAVGVGVAARFFGHNFHLGS